MAIDPDVTEVLEAEVARLEALIATVADPTNILVRLTELETGLTETQTATAANTQGITDLSTAVTANHDQIEINTTAISQLSDLVASLGGRMTEAEARLIPLEELPALIEDLTGRVQILEDAPPNKLPFQLFGPDVTAAQLSETMRDMWKNYQGGWIIVDAENQALKFTEPVQMYPGCKLWGTGLPMMFDQARTRIKPQFSGPVFIFDDGIPGENVGEAWGGSQLWDWGIDHDREGVTAIHMIGGNNSDIRNVMTSSKTPLEYGVIVDEGRLYSGDGQYTNYERLKFTRVATGVEMLRGSPDSEYRNCMFYGSSKATDRGVVLQKGAGNGSRTKPNNIEFYGCHVQFTGQGWFIDSREITVQGGSWENRQGKGPYAPWAICLGPNARDVTFRDYSIANLTSLLDVFVLDPGAKRYTFDLLTGHVSPEYVPAGLEQHFRWHSA